MDEQFTYVVVIPYREPGYELRRGGPPPSPFSARYTVRAPSPQSAVRLAVQQFERTAADSAVSWVRVIDHAGIEVTTAS